MSECTNRLKSHAPVFEVSDLSMSLDHYCDQLGFEIEFNYEGAYASVICNGCRIPFETVLFAEALLPRER